MPLGELQADILGALQKLGKGSARDIMKEIRTQHHLAYTTVSTVLDRLYRKGLVKRSRVVGRRWREVPLFILDPIRHANQSG